MMLVTDELDRLPIRIVAGKSPTTAAYARRNFFSERSRSIGIGDCGEEERRFDGRSLHLLNWKYHVICCMSLAVIVARPQLSQTKEG
ncbi:MAG: hypothetical protein JOY59_04560 [Candidatus Eremiobacteraeota bacterium]|nr:hypothetical protein [Candidatus Eremiobacteraeota bacterium]